MALSELGLTPAEVDSIMADVTGTVAPPTTAAPPTPVVLQPRTGQTSPLPAPPVAVRVTVPTGAKPPVKLTDSGSPLGPKPGVGAAKPAFRSAPVLVGVTTGLVFGGPPGALVGGAAMWALSKLLQPK